METEATNFSLSQSAPLDWHNFHLPHQAAIQLDPAEQHLTDLQPMHGAPPSDYWAPQKPNWSAWNKSRDLPLWQAVALACDVDPTIYEPLGPNTAQPIDGLFAPVPAALRECLELARYAIGSGALIVVQVSDKSVNFAEVNMAHFASWLRTMRHKTPEVFPWASEELRPGNHQWPWGSHTTKNLDLMARAADKFWKHYTPSDISTAPKSQDVVAWLVDLGMAKRAAEVVASLLRADGLPTGPR